MKFTLSWLKDHLDTEASLVDIERTLSSIGLEVDDLVDPAASLGAFTIARVIEARQHPDADKLRVCQVEVARGADAVEVVCGAPNARSGMVGVFAPLGTFIPGTGITLEKRPVRGIVSNGMLVSERELELSDDHEGIIDLDPGLAERVGERYIDVMGLADPVFEVAITPNRPDCTGVRGIARDLAAAGLGTLKPAPKLGPVDGDFDCPVPIELRFEAGAASACPVFAGRYIRGVANGPSPAWLQRRLRAVGLRPISALVDVTNYISMDRGRPLHVYDADKLSGTIYARLGRTGETFAALDDRTYEVDDEMCVIADGSGVLGLGGIIGGESTGCTNETRNVLIECAYFDPKRIAATGRRIGIQTDARYRFERGVDPEFVEGGLDLATQMIVDLCGGTPSRRLIAGQPPQGRKTITLDVARIAKLTGHDVPNPEIERILEALGFDVTKQPGGVLVVTTPSWRPDIEAPADLVEEVIRIVGLDQVKPTPLERMHGVTRAVLTDQQRRARTTRRLLAGRGLTEVVTWSFIPDEQAALFGGSRQDLKLANPISADLSTMRPGLLPGLLTAAQRNRNRGFADVAMFEIGQAYTGTEETGQLLLASGVRAGSAKATARGRDWATKAASVDVFDVKGDVMDALSAIGIDVASVQITRDAPAWYHPGRSGVIRRGPKLVLATFGEIHPSIVAALDLDAPMVGFEIALSALPPEKRKARARPALRASTLLPVRRDFAFVVEAEVKAAAILKAALGADKALVADAVVFDVFTGGSLGAGQKSVAIEVTLQPGDATLTDAEIEAVSKKIIAAVRKATGGEVRG
ncbi:MAG: phenylalanine--tRNA ligase subunit beta [Hyphomicrobiaceae bacterium]